MLQLRDKELHIEILQKYNDNWQFFSSQNDINAMSQKESKAI